MNKTKQNELVIQRIDWWLPEAGMGGMGKADEGGQKVQTFSY